MTSLSPLLQASNPPSKKPRMLVVDDEPDNLDLLYRTFRREYQVLKAESGVQALEVLAAEGEVAIIISDQRMPEMSGTEFLSKTVPDFPDTVRIILTGFTDVEDLVDAINAGQVYRYITKPWDPDELKIVVQRAADTYELLKQRNQELHIAEKQTKLISITTQLANQVMTIPEALTFMASGLGQILATDVCAIQLLPQGQPGSLGLYGHLDNASQLLAESALVKAAIASHTVQSVATLSHQPDLVATELYQITQANAHLVAPILYHSELVAFLSLQWAQAYQSLEDVNQIMNLVTAQIALAIASLKN